MNAWQRAVNRLRRLVRARRLYAGLGAAILATLVLTLVSVTIYKIGGFYRYDLSRPGYEKERASLASFPTAVSLDTTSPVTKEAATTFLEDLDKHRHNLDAYNTFAEGGLSDEDLQLTPAASP